MPRLKLSASACWSALAFSVLASACASACFCCSAFALRACRPPATTPTAAPTRAPSLASLFATSPDHRARGGAAHGALRPRAGRGRLFGWPPAAAERRRAAATSGRSRTGSSTSCSIPLRPSSAGSRSGLSRDRRKTPPKRQVTCPPAVRPACSAGTGLRMLRRASTRRLASSRDSISACSLAVERQRVSYADESGPAKIVAPGGTLIFTAPAAADEPRAVAAAAAHVAAHEEAIVGELRELLALPNVATSDPTSAAMPSCWSGCSKSAASPPASSRLPARRSRCTASSARRARGGHSFSMRISTASRSGPNPRGRRRPSNRSCAPERWKTAPRRSPGPMRNTRSPTRRASTRAPRATTRGRSSRCWRRSMPSPRRRFRARRT